VLLEIIRLRPKGVGVLEFKDNKIVRNFVDMMSQRLESTEQKLNAEKMFRNLLIRQSTTSIVLIKRISQLSMPITPIFNTVKKAQDTVIGAPLL